MEVKEAKVLGAPGHAEELLMTCGRMGAAARSYCLWYEKGRT